jgi:DNA-binding winged helix-turn-helix (wHTH) protein/TolB-like protein/Flp pilus assembly protein TadD
MSEQKSRFYEFDDFRIDAVRRHLLRMGEFVHLPPKVFDTLLTLIEHRGRVLDKDELMEAVWSDTIVEENNLTQNISAIRKALGESRGEHRYVVTVPGRGYRFVADVREFPQNGSHNGKGNRHVAVILKPTHAAVEESSQKNFQENEIRRSSKTVHPSFERTFQGFSKRNALLVTLIIGCLTAFSSWWFINQARLQKDNAAIKSIAVLPFKPLNAEETEKYIGAGMTDALITKLGNIRQISVRPTSATLRYSNLAQEPVTTGRELNVDAILDGHFQKAGDRIRLTVQLVRVSDGETLWANAFDENFRDVFAMQDSISEQVAVTLKIKLSREEQAGIQRRYTESTEAYQAFMKAHHFMNKGTMKDWDRSIEHFQKAIDLDPKYALAYAGLADCYRRINDRGVPAEKSIVLARAALMKAIEVDETVAYSYSMLGLIAFRYDWDFSRAELEYKRARELKPDLVHQWYGFYLLAMNKPVEAEAELKLFKETHPIFPGSHLGLYFYFTHQYERAEEEIRSILELHPDYAPLHSLLGLVYEQQGRYEEAETEFRRAIELSQGDVGSSQLGHLFAVTGKKTDAKKTLEELTAKTVKGRAWILFQIAVIYAGLDEKDKAVEYLEKARSKQELEPVWLRFDPRLDNLRSEPRFREFMRRVGLPM